MKGTVLFGESKNIGKSRSNGALKRLHPHSLQNRIRLCTTDIAHWYWSLQRENEDLYLKIYFKNIHRKVIKTKKWSYLTVTCASLISTTLKNKQQYNQYVNGSIVLQSTQKPVVETYPSEPGRIPDRPHYRI